jgi:hypothetical protein
LRYKTRALEFEALFYLQILAAPFIRNELNPGSTPSAGFYDRLAAHRVDYFLLLY